MKNKCAFDIDGVVADISNRICQVVNQYTDLNWCPESITNYFYVDILRTKGVSENAINKIHFDCFVGDNLLKLEPEEGAINVLSQFDDLVFITAREKSFEGVTRQWLDRYFDSSYQLYFSGCDGWNADKSKILKDLGINMFVEDSPTNIEYLIRGGITPIIYHQHWNKDFHPKEALRVYSWESIKKIIDF